MKKEKHMQNWTQTQCKLQKHIQMMWLVHALPACKTECQLNEFWIHHSWCICSQLEIQVCVVWLIMV